MITKSIIKLVFLCNFALIFAGLFSACNKGGDGNGNGDVKRGSCAEHSEKDCNAITKDTQGTLRYCVWANSQCRDADQCAKVPLNYCLRDIVEGKQCEKIKDKCEEKIATFDCSQFSSPADCNGKRSSMPGDVCKWMNGKCVSVRGLVSDKAYGLFGGNGTVCARTGFDEGDIECFGDDTGGRLPIDVGNHKVEAIKFAKDFGCAEVETKKPSYGTADDGEYQAKCWGSKGDVVTNTPNDNIKKRSLRVNDHVACAILKGGPNDKKVKCWGKFDGNLVDNATQPTNFRLNADGIVVRSLLGIDVEPKASGMSLGSDFICLRAEKPLVGGTYSVLCSGKTNFSPLKDLGALSDNIDDLTAGNDFVCIKLTPAPFANRALCVKHPVGGVASNAFMFTGADVEPGQNYSKWELSFIAAQSDYLCGVEKDKKELKCFSNPAGLAVPTNVDFRPYQGYFAFGTDFICGVTQANKVHCWGSNAKVMNGVPAALKHQ